MNTATNQLSHGGFWALTTAFALTSTQFWMTAPLAAVVLAEQGVPPWQIGLLGAAPWAALVGLLPLAPRLAARYGPLRVFEIGVWAGAVGALIFAFSSHPALWAVGYVFCGGGLALRWIVADGIVAALAPPGRRGHLVGLFETIVGATIAVGPLIVVLAGADGRRAFWIGVALAAAAIPVCFLIKLSPAALGRGQTPPRLHDLLRTLAQAPLGLVLAFTAGLVEGAGLKLFPVQALGLGFDESWAAATVSAMGAGNILTQYPVGRLCDHVPLSRIAMVALTGLGLAALLIPAATLGHPVVYLLVLAGLGGAAGSLYTLSVIRAGSAGSPLDAMGMIAGIGMVYTAGSMIGPATGGFAVTADPRFGLPLLLALVAGLALLAAMRIGGIKNPPKQL